MKKIAITGGLSSGKSTVCKILKDLGSFTVSSDDIVHHLLSHDRTLHQKIVDLLGSEVLKNNHLDREKIAKIVFSNQEKLQKLELLIHPLVFHEIQSVYSRVKNERECSLFVAEVPLLYETKSEKLFDYVITVLSDKSLCKERFKKTSKNVESEFEDRMMRQLDPKIKAQKANFILINNGSLEQLKSQVTRLYSKLSSI